MCVGVSVVRMQLFYSVNSSVFVSLDLLEGLC